MKFRHHVHQRGVDEASGGEGNTKTGIIEGAFSYKAGLLRYGGSEKSLEIGQWWLREERREDGKIEAPLADRVEVKLVRYLLQNPGNTYQEIDRYMCAAFPGLLTPSSELIDTILESYGQQTGVDRRCRSG